MSEKSCNSCFTVVLNVPKINGVSSLIVLRLMRIPNTKIPFTEDLIYSLTKEQEAKKHKVKNKESEIQNSETKEQDNTKDSVAEDSVTEEKTNKENSTGDEK